LFSASTSTPLASFLVNIDRFLLLHERKLSASAAGRKLGDAKLGRLLNEGAAESAAPPAPDPAVRVEAVDFVVVVDAGLGKVELGVGNPEVGVGKTEVGVGNLELGVGKTEVGVGKTEVGVRKLDAGVLALWLEASEAGVGKFGSDAGVFTLSALSSGFTLAICSFAGSSSRIDLILPGGMGLILERFYTFSGMITIWDSKQ
jgi:hypothetical protein